MLPCPQAISVAFITALSHSLLAWPSMIASRSHLVWAVRACIVTSSCRSAFAVLAIAARIRHFFSARIRSMNSSISMSPDLQLERGIVDRWHR